MTWRKHHHNFVARQEGWADSGPKFFELLRYLISWRRMTITQLTVFIILNRK